MNGKKLFLFTIIFTLILSQPLLLTVLSKEAENEENKNMLYDYPRFQLTDDDQPKFYLDMALYRDKNTGEDHAVFTYLVPNDNQLVDRLSKAKYDLDKRPSNSIDTIENRSDFGMYTVLTTFTEEMVIATDLMNGGTVEVTIPIATNVLGYRNPVVVDDEGYVHLAYMAPVPHDNNNSDFYIPDKPFRSVLIYQRYSIQNLLNGNFNPLNNITMTPYKKEHVVSVGLSYNPKGKNILVTWSSYMKYDKNVGFAPGAPFDYQFFVNSYVPLNNTILDNLGNKAPARYLFGQNQTSIIPYTFNIRCAYQANTYIDPSNSTHLFWSWRSTQGVRNNVFHIELKKIVPDTTDNFTLTLGGDFETPVTINDATAILRRINGFNWAGKNYVTYVSSSYALPAYAPLNVKYHITKDYPGNVKKNQVSLDIARHGEEAWALWSIQIAPSEVDQPWYYMVMTTVFTKDGTLIQSRITLTELKVHIYPNAEFTQEGHLILGWIQAYNSKTPQNPHWIYNLYLVYRPELTNTNYNPVVLLIIGILLMGGISAGAIFVIEKFVPKEEKRMEIPMPVD